MKIIFCLIVAGWILLPIIGILNSEKKRVNYEMIIFIIFSLFLPIIAKFCGLLP